MISTPSLTRTGIVALLIGVSNLLVVTANAVSTARRLSVVPGYTFQSAFTRSWSVFARADGLGIAVPVVFGVVLLLLVRREARVPTVAGPAEGRTRRIAALATAAGTLCWLPAIGLALLGVVRIVAGAEPVPWDGPFYLALVCCGGFLFALAGVLDSKHGRTLEGRRTTIRPNP